MYFSKINRLQEQLLVNKIREGHLFICEQLKKLLVVI